MLVWLYTNTIVNMISASSGLHAKYLHYVYITNLMRKVVVAVILRSNPGACTETTQVLFVFVATTSETVTVTVRWITVAMWFYTTVARPRTTNIGFVFVAGALVGVAAGISVRPCDNRPCDNADYNDGYDKADDSRDWNSNRSVTEFSCIPRIRCRSRVRHNCTNMRNDIRIISLLCSVNVLKATVLAS